MAKKKAKKAPAKKEEGSALGWVIAAIVIIVVIAFLVMKPTKEVTTEVKEKKETAPTKTVGMTSATAPEFNAKCIVAGSPTGPTMGIVPGTKKVENNVVTVTFKNNGKVNVDSVYFEFADIRGATATGKKVYMTDNTAVAPGETMKYSVDLNAVAQEMGSAVDTFTIYPTQDGKACVNGAQYVIKYAE